MNASIKYIKDTYISKVFKNESKISKFSHYLDLNFAKYLLEIVHVRMIFIETKFLKMKLTTLTFNINSPFNLRNFIDQYFANCTCPHDYATHVILGYLFVLICMNNNCKQMVLCLCV